MQYVLFIAVQLGALYWLSGQLHRHLMLLLYRVLKTPGRVVWAMNLLFWPGVLVHELSHLVVGRLLLVKTHGLTIIPKIQPDGMVQMGSVQVPVTDRFRFFLIGIAPVVVGLSLIFGVLWVADVYGLWAYWVWWAIVAYIIFQVASNMFLSASDVRGALALFIFIGLIGGLVYWLGWRPNVAWVEPWLEGNSSILSQAVRWLWVPIALDAAILMILGTVRRLTLASHR